MKSTIIFWTFCTVNTKKGGRTAFLLYKRVKRKNAGYARRKEALSTERALTLHTPPQRAAVPRRAAVTTARARRGCAARYMPPAAPPAPVFRVYARPPLPPRPLPGLYAATCRPSALAGVFPYIPPAAATGATYRLCAANGAIRPRRAVYAAHYRPPGYAPAPSTLCPPCTPSALPRCAAAPSPPAAPGTRRRFRGAKPCAGVGVVRSLQLFRWRPRPPLA